MRIPKFSWLLGLLGALGMSAGAQVAGPAGFWSMGTDREWSAKELDQAFAVFKRLKETYGDQFNLVVQDLHKDGIPKSDGTKTAQTLIKIYVAPPDTRIAHELQGVGMVFVKQP